MKNPAEEIVTAWLQECMHFFTMNNVKVPRKGGGMGAEIDILATDGNTNIWAEISVSTNPRCNYLKDIRFESTINEYLRDFDREDKNEMARKYFPNGHEKWLIYGKLALPRDEKERFEPALQNRGIKAVHFGKIFKALRDLKGYRLDAARGYMNLFEAFHNESI